MRRIAWGLAILAAGVACTGTGCRSSSSTVFSRDECNNCWTRFKCAPGVPITVKLPTHVKLYVYEKHYLQADATGGIVKAELPRMLDFAHEMVYTEKMVMVDFKRPAAGAFNLEVDFTEDQYLEKVQHDVTDETIQRVTELIGTLPTLFSPAMDDGTSADLHEVKSVVAVGMFEVDDPLFESNVQGFLQSHINGCTQGCNTFADASASAIQPVASTEDANQIFPLIVAD